MLYNVYDDKHSRDIPKLISCGERANVGAGRPKVRNRRGQRIITEDNASVLAKNSSSPGAEMVSIHPCRQEIVPRFMVQVNHKCPYGGAKHEIAQV